MPRKTKSRKSKLARSSSMMQHHVMSELNKALDYHKNHQLNLAMASYDRVLKIDEKNFDALHLLGVLYGQLGETARGIALIDQSLVLNPNHAEAHSNRANLLRQEEDAHEAIVAYSHAISLKPDYADAYYNRGLTYQTLGELEKAIADYERAISLNSLFVQAYCNKGVVLKSLNRFDEALLSFNHAIAINAQYADAYCNRGVILKDMNRIDEAISDYQRAIALDPRHIDAYNNLGNALKDTHRLKEAIVNYDIAISLQANHAMAQWNKSLALLLSGDFERGLPLYEWRWQACHKTLHKQNFSAPLWLGKESLQGKTILIHHEQGMGDTLHFCRYAKQLSQQGAHVILGIPRTLGRLLQSLEGVERILTEGEPCPDMDYHCPLMSLPLAFKTLRESDIPHTIPYIKASQTLCLEWQKKFPSQKNKPRVGLVWSGGFIHYIPEQLLVSQRRNISFSQIATLNIPECDFYSLQKGDIAERELRNNQAIYWKTDNLHVFSDDIQDFADTAAFIEHLDLVIAVDTSTAHLAGAMGKPVWLLNRFDTCWRWLLAREDSPWYPTMKIYRQQQPGDWQNVLERVKLDLSKWVNEMYSTETT